MSIKRCIERYPTKAAIPNAVQYIMSQYYFDNGFSRISQYIVLDVELYTLSKNKRDEGRNNGQENETRNNERRK